LEPCDSGSRNQRWKIQVFQPASNKLSMAEARTAPPPSAQQLGVATPRLRVHSNAASNSTAGLSWPGVLNSQVLMFVVVPALLSMLLCGMIHGALSRTNGLKQAMAVTVRQSQQICSTTSNSSSSSAYTFTVLPPFVGVPSAHCNVPLEPRTDVLKIPDPRLGAHPLRDVSVCIFGKDADAACGCEFLELAHNLGPYGGMVLDMAGKRRSFPSGRAALDALLGANDGSSAWDSSLVVQKAKFRSGSALDRALERTGDAFLLHRGTDKNWADGGNGEGRNLLGMQLMLLRDFRNGWRRWTSFIEVSADPQTGLQIEGATDAWQNVVRSAAHVAQQHKVEARERSRQAGRRNKRGSPTAAVASAGKAFREDRGLSSNDDGLESSPLLR